MATLEDLLGKLESPAPSLRRHAAQALGRIGDRRAAPALLNHLADEDPAVAEDAAGALLAMRGREVAARLVPLLSVEQVGLRNWAMELLREAGSDAPDLVLDLLDDNDPDLRIFAADILGHISAPGVVRALTKALKDKDPNVRAAAATSLGKLAEPSAAPALIKMLGDQEWVSFAVIEALAIIGDPQAVNPLLKTMETGSDLLRAAAAQALTRFSGSRAVGAILAAMQPARGHFLQQLLSALLKIASPDVLRGLDQDIQERAFFSLMDALDDPSDEVKSDALRGLAVLGDLGSVYNILDLARRTETPEVVDLIKAALTGIGEIGPLVGAAAEGNPRVAETAIYVLGELGGDEAISAMVGALGHASARVRRQAAGSLGKIGAQQAQAALVEAMNGEEDIEVLVEAATALGRLGDSMPVPALAALLTHADRGVREAALNALMAIGGPAARRVCIEGLSSKHPLRRGLCAQGLGMLGPGRDASHLAALLDDPEPEVRRRTVLALLASGDSQSLGFLRAALADPDAEVRLTLVKALALNYPAEGRDILIESLCDSDITVRLEAIAGLGRTRASQALEPLLDKLASGDAREKISAAVALGAMGSPEASEGLMGLLCDPNPKVRAAGAEAISRIQAGSWLALSKN